LSSLSDSVTPSGQMLRKSKRKEKGEEKTDQKHLPQDECYVSSIAKNPDF